MANSKKVTVEGEWEDRKRERGFFTETFILGPEVKDIPQARVIIQNGLLTPKMQSSKDYPNFSRWRTAQVIEFEDSSEMPENSELNNLLMEATNMDAIPDRLDSYKTPEAKSRVLTQAIQNEKKRRGRKPKGEVEVIDQGFVD